jgi:hypothetical protein
MTPKIYQSHPWRTNHGSKKSPMNLTDECPGSASPSEQEQIDRIIERLAEIAGRQAGRLCSKAEERWMPWDNYELFENDEFRLRKKSLTQHEIDSLNQNLPTSHREFLKQFGFFILAHGECLGFETFAPRPWEESDYCAPIEDEYRMPHSYNYLCIAHEGGRGQYFGYDISRVPFQLVVWDFVDCRPQAADQHSFLDLVEYYLCRIIESNSLG